MDIGRPATRPRHKQTHHKIATYILAVDNDLTQMGTATSSHGYKVEESHTSATCRFLSSNPNNSATRIKIMGGKTWNKKWTNGEPME